MRHIFSGALASLSPDHAKDVQRMMFAEVNRTNSDLCYEQLYDILDHNEVKFSFWNGYKLLHAFSIISSCFCAMTVLVISFES